jgi:cysteine desulfurase family protein (TIGR01976 family)
MRTFDVEGCRSQFPALARRVGGRPAVFFDGPGGSQVPRRVIDAVAHYLGHANANTHGAFATAIESDAILDEARAAAADFLGAADPATVAFGPNMTTLTFALSRALARGWGPGDEVVVTDLDHDANVTPWVRAAGDAGATVRRVRFRPEDGTLDLDALRAALSPRTRLLAVGCASNALGTINPVQEIARLAHAHGALVFLDAVHHAPHAAIDVEGWGCDFLSCSAYKFFGPHVGLLYGRKSLLDALPAYKVRPASDETAQRWETGTQNHEGIAGTLAAIEYLAALGRDHDPAAGSRRAALLAAWEAIRAYESGLALRLLDVLARAPGVRVYGLTDPARVSERTPTCSFTHARRTAAEVAARLAERGICSWSGNFYALGVTETLGLEPAGLLRVGLLHYNTAAEIDRLGEALGDL